MAQSSRYFRLDEDILLEFIYHDQSNPDSVKIENDDNGSQLKFLNLVEGDDSSTRFLINELGGSVVNFGVDIEASYVVINNFAKRELQLQNSNTYKFDLSALDNPAGFQINDTNTTLIGDVLTYIPNTNGEYTYTYTDLSGTQYEGGKIIVSVRANSLFSTPTQQTGNTINTGTGEVGRWYAVPTDTTTRWALLDNALQYLDDAAWLGTKSVDLSVVPTVDVQAVWYDSIRLHLRNGFSFQGRGYDGFHFATKVKRESGVYNYFNSQVYLNSSNFEIMNPTPFTLGDASYSRYIELKVPSLVYMFDPVRNGDFHDQFFGATPDSLLSSANYEIELNLINNTQEIDGINYINVQNAVSFSVAREDEFVDLGVSIVESQNGDYFEIGGVVNGSNSEFEDYIVRRLTESSDDLMIFFDIEVSEQIGLNYIKSQQLTLVQEENWSQAITFRPIVLNSNISSNFLLRCTMRIYNISNNTQIVKVASIIYDRPKKYGRRFVRLETNNNIVEQVIYNKLPNTAVNRDLNQFINSVRPETGETKYVPTPIDTYNIVAGISAGQLDSGRFIQFGNIEYTVEGETEMRLTEVADNYIKFKAVKALADGTYEDINLINAENVVLVIKSGEVTQRILHDPTFPGVDMTQGEVFFKVPKATAVRFNQEDTNQLLDRFYINIVNGETETNLYYGKVQII